MSAAREKLFQPGKRRQAARRAQGGLSGFFLPPLAALFVGLLLAAWAGGLSDSDVRPLPAEGAVIAPLFTPEVQFWRADLARWAAEHGLDANLAATVMQIESCGHPEIYSSAGAAGLFQVMPFHFAAGEQMTNPDTNAQRGLDYLRRALEQAAGDPRLAFAGYNGGIGLIGQMESFWPEETTRYAYWAGGIYADARQNLAESARLNEWLNAGGASLCQKARQRLGLGQ